VPTKFWAPQATYHLLPGSTGILRNIITDGNISPNSPSGGSINDILHRKLKASSIAGQFENVLKSCLRCCIYGLTQVSSLFPNHISFIFLSAILFAGLPRVVYANHVTRAHVKYDDKARFDDKFHAHVAQT
jgi:hypothetical protein